MVERLSVRGWLFDILPWIARRGHANARLTIWFIDASGIAHGLARACSRILGVHVARLSFRLGDIRDEDGVFTRLRVASSDFARIQRDILESPTARRVLEHVKPPNRLRFFFGKRITYFDIAGYSIYWRALLVIQITAWFVRTQWKTGNTTLVLTRRPWMEKLAAYAAEWDLNIVAVSASSWDVRALALRIFGDRVSMLKGRAWQLRRLIGLFGFCSLTRARGAPSRARLGVEFCGQLNLDNPQGYSDLFFWQGSSLPAGDLVLTFALPHTPFDERKQDELRRHGISAAVLHPNATTLPDAPVYFHTSRRGLPRPSVPPPSVYDSSAEGRWLKTQESFYASEYYAWSDFFLRSNIRVYVLWQKFSAMHSVIADAIQSVGGILAIYQRAMELIPSPETAACPDVMFGYSKHHADMERRSGSRIPYHVIVGYLGDFRFSLLREHARELRATLLSAGARYILCYMDENSAEDARWYAGHEFMRESYAFWLQHVLKEPWFGLIIKPKTPSTLRHRLGPVATLLDQAIATGRCVLLGGGELHVHGTTPVALAATASDLFLQEHFGGSAALEAALAGTRTILFDREGYPQTLLHQLPKDKVIFYSREDMWQAIQDDFQSGGKLPGLGDWASVLPELDPFRDGLAASRMGTYLHWLLSGLQAGGAREQVLTEAAERYEAQWGKGLVSRIP